MSKAFTYMSSEGVDAVIGAQRATIGQYEIALNHSDFLQFVKALELAYYANEGDASEWAGAFLSSIAESFGIEFV